MNPPKKNNKEDKHSLFKIVLLTSIIIGVLLLFKNIANIQSRLLNQESFEQAASTHSENTNSIAKGPESNNQNPYKPSSESNTESLNNSNNIASKEQKEEPKEEPNFQEILATHAEQRLQSDVTYNGRYEKIAYPMGDVPAHIGVCTDVVIRTYRKMGIDLQQRVHEDMKSNFRAYPKKWKLKRPDTNIDHRRVPNLMTYFKRAGAALPITDNPYDYKTGHVVTWDLGNGMVHIGIVSDKLSMTSGNPLIIHNIGSGPEISDILFRYEITGHYLYGT